jgi:hypothetical protein
VSNGGWEPENLGPRGSALWRNVTSRYALRPDELSILADACHEADIIELLKAEFETSDLRTTGSMGQDVIAPHVSEIRQHRNTHAALMAKLRLPDEDGGKAAGDAASEAGRALVNKRWRPRSAG